MQIVPVITKKGVFYQVRKRYFFSIVALGKDGEWIGKTRFIDLRLLFGIMFDTPIEAAKEIEKQFGETAEVEPWIPRGFN